MSDKSPQPEEEQPAEQEETEQESQDSGGSPQLDEKTQERVKEAEESEDGDPANLNGPAGEGQGGALA